MIIPMPTVTLVRYQPPLKSIPSTYYYNNGVNSAVCVVTANLRADSDHVLCVSELGFGEWHQRERERDQSQARQAKSHRMGNNNRLASLRICSDLDLKLDHMEQDDKAKRGLAEWEFRRCVLAIVQATFRPTLPIPRPTTLTMTSPFSFSPAASRRPQPGAPILARSRAI